MAGRVIGLVVGVLIAAGASLPSPQELQGLVFEDRNANGVRESGERGLGGVVVSNQIVCAVTGEDGSFRLDRGHGIVFVSTPPTHRAIGPFWKRVPDEPSKSSVEFALRPTPTPEAFSFLHASDTHLSEQSLPRMRRLREIVDQTEPAFVLITGDLVQDALRVSEQEARGYYELYRREIDAFPVPVYSVPGNHEIFGIERHLSLVSKDHPLYGKAMYREYLGPTYYSFTFGRVHFIGLDNVDYEDLWYYGHVDETQLDWLERDLLHHPAAGTVVTFMHMPLFSAGATLLDFADEHFIRIEGENVYRHAVSNPTEILGRLEGFPHSLALAGHIHAREMLQFETAGSRTRFYQTAAVAGPSNDKLNMLSGVVLYRVQGNVIDDGEFIPLDASEVRRR